MKLFLRLFIPALICAAATILVAGAMTWGFVETSSRTGFFYHWLYTGQYLISGMLDANSWFSMLATYFVQYMVVFVLVLLVARAVRRRLEFKNQVQNHE
jgi:ABC-type Fe3+ transport system permease subunit